MSDDADDVLFRDIPFDFDLWMRRLQHEVLYGSYGTPVTLSWDVEHVEAELVLS